MKNKQEKKRKDKYGVIAVADNGYEVCNDCIYKYKCKDNNEKIHNHCIDNNDFEEYYIKKRSKLKHNLKRIFYAMILSLLVITIILLFGNLINSDLEIGSGFIGGIVYILVFLYKNN